MTQIEKAKETLKKLLTKNVEITDINTKLNEQVKDYSEILQTKETEIVSLKDQIKVLEDKVSSSETLLTEEKNKNTVFDNHIQTPVQKNNNINMNRSIFSESKPILETKKEENNQKVTKE